MRHIETRDISRHLEISREGADSSLLQEISAQQIYDAFTQTYLDPQETVRTVHFCGVGTMCRTVGPLESLEITGDHWSMKV